jgi:hypothetical protein
MSLATKLTKAKKLGIKFEEGYEPKEAELDKLIEAKMEIAGQQKEEARIQKANEKKAEEEAKKNIVILKDVDGDDVDQAEYFFPRTEAEKIGDKRLEPTDQTAPIYFNKTCGMPVERDELIEIFLQFFPRSKGFLFYKARDREVYLVIVPLKYATTITKANESRPGDFQRHALSFIAEGSVNVESLKLKLARIAKHTSISTEAIAR